MRAKNKLDFSENKDGCFIVTSHQPNKDGYCYVRHNYTQLRVHRLVYQECFGEIAEGLVVRHKCDVRNCINPEHMELGTHKDNSRDSVERGRKAIGENTHKNKITEEEAREIKRLIRDGIRNYEIVKLLDISIYIVRSIRKSRTWKHVKVSS